MIVKIYHFFKNEGEYKGKPYINTYCVGRRIVGGEERGYAVCKFKGAHTFDAGAEYIFDVVAIDNGVNIINHYERR